MDKEENRWMECGSLKLDNITVDVHLPYGVNELHVLQEKKSFLLKHDKATERLEHQALYKRIVETKNCEARNLNLCCANSFVVNAFLLLSDFFFRSQRCLACKSQLVMLGR